MPMRDAAATQEISDVGLRKVCVRQGVPVPPRGYWNKVRAGHKMPLKPKLPPVAEHQRNEFELFAPPPLHGAALQSQSAANAKQEARDARPHRTRKAKTSTESTKPKRVLASPRVAAKSKKRRKYRYEQTRFTMPIGRWSWDYGYGINWMKKYVRGHFLDSRHLDVYGRLMLPSELAGTPVRLSFLTFDPKEAAMSNRLPRLDQCPGRGERDS
jgi:hypothetical protein